MQNITEEFLTNFRFADDIVLITARINDISQQMSVKIEFANRQIVNDNWFSVKIATLIELIYSRLAYINIYKAVDPTII